MAYLEIPCPAMLQQSARIVPINSSSNNNNNNNNNKKKKKKKKKKKMT
jgi:hypothetical protein